MPAALQKDWTFELASQAASKSFYQSKTFSTFNYWNKLRYPVKKVNWEPFSSNDFTAWEHKLANHFHVANPKYSNYPINGIKHYSPLELE